VTETGLVFDGVEYEVDCIIFATGFEVGTAYTRRSGFEVYGRDGRKLTDYWSSGLRTLHGFYSHGFPNCFYLGVTQNTFTPNLNFPHMLDEQARHVAHVVKAASEQQAQMVEPTLVAESGWLEIIRATAIDTLAFRQACTPGYYNGEGRTEKGQGLFDNLYGPGSDAFFALMKAWREAGDMCGLQVR
jgi:cyclohexanone monooxygenase